MDAQAIAKRLNSGMNVIDESFVRNNLRVVGFGFCSIEENGNMKFIVEIESISKRKLPCDIDIIINLYDEDGDLIHTDEGYIEADYFEGYDTITIQLYEDKLAFRAARCRLYAKREE